MHRKDADNVLGKKTFKQNDKKNEDIQAEGRISAETDTTTHVWWVLSDVWKGLCNMKLYIVFFLRKMLQMMPLSLNL